MRVKADAGADANIAVKGDLIAGPGVNLLISIASAREESTGSNALYARLAAKKNPTIARATAALHAR